MKWPFGIIMDRRCAKHLADYLEYMGRGYHVNHGLVIELTNPDSCDKCLKVGHDAAWKEYQEWVKQAKVTGVVT